MALIKEYRSDMQKNELLLTFAKDGEVPGYYEKMVRYNDIWGVLKFRLDMNDGVRRYVYDASGRRPLGLEYEEKRPGYTELKNVLYDIIEAIEGCREYLIDEEDFVINDECIFLDDDGNAAVCCLPGYCKPLKNQFTALFEFFMDRIDYKDKAAVVALYDLYRKSKENGCNFEYIKKTFGKREKSAKKEAKARPETSFEMQELFAKEPDPVAEKEQVVKQNVSQPQGDLVRELPKRKRRTLFSFMQKAEETSLLYSVNGCVLKSPGGKTINVDKWPFVIGKGDASHRPDYCLEYPQISRFHARFSKAADGSFCIEDMKSLNGTFVNGSELTPGTPVKLGFGDKVCFANMQFTFET